MKNKRYIVSTYHGSDDCFVDIYGSVDFSKVAHLLDFRTIKAKNEDEAIEKARECGLIWGHDIFGNN